MAALVSIGTDGNQRFLFSTNKRKENAGASELIDGLGARFDEACDGVAGVEVVARSSGKVLAVVGDEASGRRLVTRVTAAMLERAPGLEVVGAVVPVAQGDHGLSGAVEAVHARAGSLRGRWPGPAARFARAPFVAECGSSGLPAAGVVRLGDDVEERSASSIAKLGAWPAARTRLAGRLGVEPDTLANWVVRLGGEQGHEEDEASAGKRGVEGRFCEWVAVVHADGNGIGSLFTSRRAPADNEAYREQVPELSRRLDVCARDALRAAFGEIGSVERAGPPVLPLVVGGDDLTLVCDGSIALALTARYLELFEERTAGDEVVARAVDAVTGGSHQWLTASAGVAVVKAHFPFSHAYELAEDLTNSAKRAARPPGVGGQGPAPLSMIDFHRLLDSTSTSLSSLRRRITVGSGDRQRVLTRRPYVVTPPGRWSADSEHPSWEELQECTRLVSRQEAGAVPRSQLLRLRPALREGDGAAEREYERSRVLYPDSPLARTDRPLYEQHPDPDDPGGSCDAAWLLDALDADELGVTP